MTTLAYDDPFTADLAFAHALAARDRVALEVFERELAPRLRDSLARFKQGDDFVSEIVQRVRIKLLVGDGTPRVLEYRGRGRFVSWLQVVTLREALMELRRRKRQLPSADLIDIAIEPELVLAQDDTHRRELAAAFRHAMAELDEREREVLRLCLVDGIAGDQLASTFGVHRVTTFRWLRSAYKKLRDRTRALFVERVTVTAAEADKLMATLSCELSVDITLLGVA